VCCRPEDASLDAHGRPKSDDDRLVAMIVRRNVDRETAFRAVPGAVNLAAEGTIIGDGRKWDTVQFVPVASNEELQRVVASHGALPRGEAFVVGIRASMDAITQG
jgi:hypothetical protein